MKNQKRNNNLFANEERNERSQTSIIVTVLLILVAIAGVVVIAAWIIPMIKDNLAAGNLKADISIDREGTFYNTDVPDCGLDVCLPSPRTYVKVSRGSTGTGELYAIKFIFHKGDKSLIYINTNVPSPSESLSYVFLLVDENKTDSVDIVPIMLVNDKQKALDVADSALVGTDSRLIPLNNLQRCSQAVNADAGNFPSDPQFCLNP